MGWLGSCNPVRNALKLNILTKWIAVKGNHVYDLCYKMQILRGLYSTETLNIYL